MQTMFDFSMTEIKIEDMTTRLTDFADASLDHADMKMKLSKTGVQMLDKQGKTAAAMTEEIQTKMKQYKYKCEFAGAGCSQRFKTKRDMKIHSCNCNFDYVLLNTRSTS